MTTSKERPIRRKILEALYKKPSLITSAALAEQAALNRTQVQEQLPSLRDMGLVEQHSNQYIALNFAKDIDLTEMGTTVLCIIGTLHCSFTIQELATKIGKRYAATQKHVDALRKANLLDKQQKCHFILSKTGLQYLHWLEIFEDKAFSVPLSAPVATAPEKRTTAKVKQAPVSMKKKEVAPKKEGNSQQEVQDMVEALVEEPAPQSKQGEASLVESQLFAELDKELLSITQPAAQQQPLGDVPAKLHIIQNLRDKLPADSTVETHLAELELYLIKLAS